ncbi:MAG: UDP-N-acetylmuramoyl-L-alanine--D-glutamate ligase [Armatimonadota bacterium]|nr:UDP-N-acetylmuramoyl-L-alanine--D-glutamate ligase [Armatimonadota bacterium]
MEREWRTEGSLTGLRVAVIGMARTGRAVVAALQRRGAKVLAFDSKPIERNDEINGLLAGGMELACGPSFPGIEKADILVPSPGMDRRSPVLQEAVARRVPVLSEIEIAYRISAAPIVAFTGTNGKSTTTVLCGHMLKAGGIAAEVGGNLAPGTPLVTLADRATSRNVLVAEISSFQLEWIDGFRPRVAGILNLSEEHLLRHGTMQEYAAAKARIAENQSGMDLAIFGDAFAEEYPDLLRGSGRHYRFCKDHPVESGAYLDGSTIRVVGRVDPAEGSLPDLKIDLSRFTLSGAHNAENAMAAALAALEMGVRPEAIERSLRTFPGLPHRMELVGEKNGIRFVNNSMCTNAAAAIASLESVAGPVVVITGGKSKGLDMQSFGEALAAKARWSILIGETAGEMESYLTHAGSSAFEHAGTMDSAVDAAMHAAEPGDTVLLLPGFASFDMFKDFADRGLQFKRAVSQL